MEEAERMLDEAERDDNDPYGDKDRNTRERDAKIMEQIRESNRKRLLRKKANFDD
jgi:hypothetical protein